MGLEDADWYANELFNELAELGEQRFPKLGELCFFSYTAAYPEEYPYYDQRPLAYILEYRGDKILERTYIILIQVTETLLLVQR